jgi:hypothetical protein
VIIPFNDYLNTLFYFIFSCSRQSGCCCHISALLHTIVFINLQDLQKECTGRLCQWLIPANAPGIVKVRDMHVQKPVVPGVTGQNPNKPKSKRQRTQVDYASYHPVQRAEADASQARSQAIDILAQGYKSFTAEHSAACLLFRKRNELQV